MESSKSHKPHVNDGFVQGASAHTAIPGTPLGVRARIHRNKTLIAACVVLAALFVLIVIYSVLLWGNHASAVTSFEVLSNSHAENEAANDGERPAQTTTIPSLVDLLGKDTAEAMALLARGALLQASVPFEAPDSDIVTQTVILLTAEYAPASSAQPTVILGLNADGIVESASYEASMDSLGYGVLSFEDAIENVGVIEKALFSSGLAITEPLVLPDDRMAYSTIASDGRTVETQTYDFAGSEAVGGEDIDWKATLTYSYVAANASGNLADTQRFVAITLAYT